jgi:urease accessory protein
MLTLTQICAPSEHVAGVLVLPFALRQKSRLRAFLDSGEEVALILPRGTVVRGGDYLSGEERRVVQVVAATEEVCRIDGENHHVLARCAYHLGNRHVPLQIGDGWLRIERDPLLKEMLVGLGARVRDEKASFEPEGGAYGSPHAQPHDHPPVSGRPLVFRRQGT